MSSALLSGNQIFRHEIEYVLYFVWPLSFILSLLLAPHGFLRRPSRVLLYAALGPIGALLLVRATVRAQREGANEQSPARIRPSSAAVVGVVLILLGSGVALAVVTRPPDWYLPVLRAHRALGLALLPGYCLYILLHLWRTSSRAAFRVHAIFTGVLFVALLWFDPRKPGHGWATLSEALLVAALAIGAQRLDRRAATAKSRGGLFLNGWVVVLLASGLYMVPWINARLSTNFGNYYYNLHGLAALFGIPAAAAVFLHHVRRGAGASAWPRVAAALLLVPLAVYVVFLARRFGHPPRIGDFRSSMLVASGTAGDPLTAGLALSTPDAVWLNEMNEVQSCTHCHDVLTSQWLGSAHASAGRNIAYRAVLARLVSRGRLDETRFCQACHQPALSALADRHLATSDALMAADQGVSCKVCHLTYAIADPPRNGMAVFRTEDRISGVASEQNGSYEAIRDDLRLHLKEFSDPELFASPAFCAECHRIDLPGDAPRHAELTLPNPYEAGVATPRCKSCHMPEDSRNAAGVLFPNHAMFGANARAAATLPPATDSLTRSAATADDALTAAWLTGEPSQDLRSGQTPTGPALTVHLGWTPEPHPGVLATVENVRGGHPFPLGAPDLIEVWLAVSVTGPDGILFDSGDLDADGRLPLGARRFGSTFLGADGKPLGHHDLLGIAAIGDQHLLMPGVPRPEAFDLAADVALKYPLVIRAELRYRRDAPGFLRDVLGQGAPLQPVSVLAAASCRVERPGTDCRP